MPRPRSRSRPVPRTPPRPGLAALAVRRRKRKRRCRDWDGDRSRPEDLAWPNRRRPARHRRGLPRNAPTKGRRSQAAESPLAATHRLAHVPAEPQGLPPFRVPIRASRPLADKSGKNVPRENRNRANAPVRLTKSKVKLRPKQRNTPSEPRCPFPASEPACRTTCRLNWRRHWRIQMWNRFSVAGRACPIGANRSPKVPASTPVF